MEVLKLINLFDLNHTIAKELLVMYEYPYQVLPHIKNFIIKHGETLSAKLYRKVQDDIWISNTATIAATTVIKGPAIIGHGAELRYGAYLRGSVIIGENSIIGNSTEVKNSIIFDGVQIPHFNYVGDSILGYKSHMGAGAVASNVKSDKKCVVMYIGNENIETNLKKLGTMLGDYAEVGCNSVCCPGSVVGRNSIIYPLTRVRGYIPPNTVCKGEGRITARV